MAGKTLILRADAGPAMGHGHVMRCLALAQAWQDAGGHAVLATVDPPPALAERLRAEGMTVARLNVSPAEPEDAAQLVNLARAHQAEWVALDGYHFRSGYQRQIKEANLKLLVVDDLGGAGPYFADFVLNQNYGATEKMYGQREPYTQLLLGPGYVMLRREFQAWRGWKRTIAPLGRKVLVTMGGSDPDGLARRVVESLAPPGAEGPELLVVAGNTHSDIDLLKRLASGAANKVRHLEGSSGLAEWMAEADLAIIAAGGTLWELLFLGCPVLSYARNEVQERILSQLAAEAMVSFLGKARDFDAGRLRSEATALARDSSRRQLMSARGRQLIDGCGCERICDVLLSRR